MRMGFHENQNYKFIALLNVLTEVRLVSYRITLVLLVMKQR